jgi:peptidoglycan/LPS O-acetylase OafA/YrhL
VTVALEEPPVNPAPAPRAGWLFRRARTALASDLDAPSTWPLLDSLRGTVVLAVIAWHVFRLTANHVSPNAVPFYFWPLGATRLGVDVFFVLSGFLVIRSWRSVRARASSTTRALVEYAGRRARRILPAYWVSLVVLVALWARPVLDNPRHVLLFATVQEYVRFVLPARVNVVYWSLTVETQFYVVVPLLAWLMFRLGRWTMLAACLTLSFMWWSHRPPMQLPQGSLFGHLDQFVAGAIVGELVVAHAAGAKSAILRIARLRSTGLLIALGLIALGSYHGSTLGTSRGNGFDPLLHPLFGLLAAAGILHLLTRSHRAWLEHRALRALGLISFSLYLWHYPILRHGLPWGFEVAPMPALIWKPLTIVVFVGVAFLVATLSYLLVERPFLANAKHSKATVIAADTQHASPEPNSATGARR